MPEFFLPAAHLVLERNVDTNPVEMDNLPAGQKFAENRMKNIEAEKCS